VGCSHHALVLFECLAGFAGHWRPCEGVCVSDFRWCVSIQCGQGLHSAQAHQTKLAQGKDGNAISCQCAVTWYKSSLLFSTFFLLNWLTFDYVPLPVIVLCTSCTGGARVLLPRSKEQFSCCSTVLFWAVMHCACTPQPWIMPLHLMLVDWPCSLKPFQCQYTSHRSHTMSSLLSGSQNDVITAFRVTFWESKALF